MHNVLFIGGPLDGRRENFETLMSFYEVALPLERLPLTDFFGDIPKYTPLKTFTYHLCHIEQFHVYIPRDSNHHSILRFLINRYPLPLPT